MLLSRLSPPVAALLPRIGAPRRIVVARLVAVLAVALLFAASAAIVMAGSAKPALSEADAQYINTRLVDIDQSVRTHLVRLAPAGGVARARRSTREALAALNSLARPVRGADGSSSALLGVAIADEVRFLDAVGSVLMNPGSALVQRLPALDAAARRSVAALPGPVAHRKGGVRALQRRWRDSAAAGA
jgi:hypothetical protein